MMRVDGGSGISERQLGFLGAVAVLVGCGATTSGEGAGTLRVVRPSVETAAVPHRGDAADDACVWVHPVDPARSLVIGTDKRGGLAVHDLDGKRLQYIELAHPNNTDIRHGVPIGGRPRDVVATGERSARRLVLHEVDAGSRRLRALGGGVSVGLPVYGSCLYRPRGSDRLQYFVTTYEGLVEQGDLVGGEVDADDGAGKDAATSDLRARPRRRLRLGSEVEGCVADDDLARLYLAEEDVGIWCYEIGADGPSNRRLVDRVGYGRRLGADVEGLTIYRVDGRRGYLIASSQGRSEFVVYRREEMNEPVGRFRIGAGGGIDAVSSTDGIAACSCALGPRFPAGVLVVQDDDNGGEPQNFKLLSWSAIAGAWTPPLARSAGCGVRPTATPSRSHAGAPARER